MIIASRMHFVNVSLECIFFFTYFMFGMTNLDVFVLNDLDFGQDQINCRTLINLTLLIRTQMDRYLMRNNEDSDTYFFVSKKNSLTKVDSCSA